MANKNLFKKSAPKKTKNKVEKYIPKPVPAAETKNAAGGRAYKMDKYHTLAQIAATNCFNGTFYASAQDNLKLAKDAAQALKGDPEFIAKVAVYSRDKAYMKDMPAFLTAMLAELDKPLFRKVFRRVIDNGKMLRNVIMMARSGSVTSKPFNMSAGTFRHAIQEWFDRKSPEAIFKASIGNDPSMKDILRMCHPAPRDQNGEYSPVKAALFAYLRECELKDGYFRAYRGKGRQRKIAFQHPFTSLPEVVLQYENWKRTKEGPVPDVDFRMLDSLGLGQEDWTEIARNAQWQMTRMNLNTFARHGVFKNSKVATMVAERLRNADLIAKARQFPYQLYVAWRETEKNADIPFKVKDALQDAMEIAINNVPMLPGNGILCMDTSGSMVSSITGSDGKVSTVKCVEVAGLIASAVYRKNRDADIYTFNSNAVNVNLNPRDTVLTNTQKLAKAGGGTNISAPLRDLNTRKAKADWVLYVSDYESWIDSGFNYSYGYGSGTSLAHEWEKFKTRNPRARLICCDLTPRSNSQIKTRKDVLQVGGFSDSVFDVMASFVEHGMESDHWVSEIDKISID